MKGVTSIDLVPLGGLCNRLRAILSAIALAEELQVPLRIVWLRDAGLNARFDDLFRPLRPDLRPSGRQLGLSVVESSATFRYGVPRRRNLWLPSLWQRRAYDTRLPECSAVSPMSLRGRVLIQTGLGFYPADDRLLTHFFVPSEAVRVRMEARQAGLTPYTVGVHIRRTDNHQSAAHSPLSAFVEAMEADVEREPRTSFYVASDDASVVASLSARFPSRIQTSPQSAPAIAQAAAVPSASGFYAARGSVAGMQEAVAELFTLIACPHFHGSYWSSFSDAVVGCHEADTADIICVDPASFAR